MKDDVSPSECGPLQTEDLLQEDQCQGTLSSPMDIEGIIQMQEDQPPDEGVQQDNQSPSDLGGAGSSDLDSQQSAQATVHQPIRANPVIGNRDETLPTQGPFTCVDSEMIQGGKTTQSSTPDPLADVGPRGLPQQDPQRSTSGEKNVTSWKTMTPGLRIDHQDCSHAGRQGRLRKRIRA